MARLLPLLVLGFALLFAPAAWAQVSPFDGLRWVDEKPEVQLEDRWYALLELHGHGIDEVLEACEERYGKDLVQKRIREDLTEVMRLVGVQVSREIDLGLKDLESGEVVQLKAVRMTRDKRQALWTAAQEDEGRVMPITGEQAKEDLLALRTLLSGESSYLFLHGPEALKALDDTALEAVANQKVVAINELWWMAANQVGAIGDRHASVRTAHRIRWDSSAGLPFILVPEGTRALALQPVKDSDRFELYDPEFPYVTAIAGESLEHWISIGLPRHRHAPPAAKWAQGLEALNEIGEFMGPLGIPVAENLPVRFSNLKMERDRTVDLARRANRWTPIEATVHLRGNSPRVASQYFTKQAGGIGVVRVPGMFSRSEFPAFFALLKDKLTDPKDLRALVIDLRDNGGGVRDLLMVLAPYIVSPAQSPWVGNVARVRVSNPEEAEHPLSGMAGRYLFPRGDGRWKDADRAAIDAFEASFKPQWKFDPARFSEPYYLLLHADPDRYLDIPVYVLINERSFSAASVFAACVKGLDNVQLVGVTTDGSSGRSQTTTLPHSGLRIRYSTMISFQRDGRVLDGNGTEPDIPLPPDRAQLLGERDSQMQALLERIRAGQ